VGFEWGEAVAVSGRGDDGREVAAHTGASGGGIVADRPEEEDEGRGLRVSEGEGGRRAGPSQPGGQGPRGVGEGVAYWAGGGGSGPGRGGGSRLAESQGPGNWAEILSRAL
jgi:hypothetical protein